MSEDRAAEIESSATTLWEAARSGDRVAMLTDSLPDLSAEDGYAIQRALVALRVDSGESVVGMKMGLTSEAKRKQVSVHEPIYGTLTDAMAIEDGGSIKRDAFVHPRVEPEVALILGSPLEGRVSRAEAEAAIDYVAPAIEVLDSRYENFRFALPDVVADNTSAAAYSVGRPTAWPGPSLTNLGVLLEIDGEIVDTASTAAVMGDPVRSLVVLSELAGRAGLRLEAGWVVLTGGITAAAPIPEGGRVRATIADLGTAELRVVG